MMNTSEDRGTLERVQKKDREEQAGSRNETKLSVSLFLTIHVTNSTESSGKPIPAV